MGSGSTIILIHFFVERVLAVAKMVPFWSTHSELDVLVFL